jgi:hypothetical protein
MDDDDQYPEHLINALRHEVQHLTMQVKMLQDSIQRLKNVPANEPPRNYLGAWTIGKIVGKD